MATTSIFTLLFILSTSVYSSKLLVTTGWPDVDGVKSEVIDLRDSSNICKPLPDFPYKVRGATG